MTGRQQLEKELQPWAPSIQPRKLETGDSIRWLMDEGLTAPIPSTSRCKGCYLEAYLTVDFLRKWCERCEAQHAKVLTEPQLVAKEEEDKRWSLQGSDLAMLAKSLMEASNVATKDGSVPVIIMSARWLMGNNTAHDNALFFYVNPRIRKVDVRLFDPHSEKDAEAGAAHAAFVPLLEEFLPRFIAWTLPGWTSGFESGDRCARGLQRREATEPGETELQAAQRARDAIREKYLELRKTKASDAPEVKAVFDEFMSQNEAIETIRAGGAEIQAAQQAYDQNLERMGKLLTTDSPELHSVLAELKTHLFKKLQDLRARSAKCPIPLKGNCTGWTNMIILTHVAFPTASVDDIASDLYDHHKKAAKSLEDLVTRFSWNLANEVAEANEMCCKDGSMRYTVKDKCPVG